eukprot:TRINITY_DN427_c0_g1_i5.p1 TRINITY_DN427_c0_g1~~TRINITY_DN427_c0_g1_i5.p1  ORF type:complete len:149 (+),score=19.79 TRINITY_DN427_c0_g1_i5:451-897(+)
MLVYPGDIKIWIRFFVAFNDQAGCHFHWYFEDLQLIFCNLVVLKWRASLVAKRKTFFSNSSPSFGLLETRVTKFLREVSASKTESSANSFSSFLPPLEEASLEEILLVVRKEMDLVRLAIVVVFFFCWLIFFVGYFCLTTSCSLAPWP